MEDYFSKEEEECLFYYEHLQDQINKLEQKKPNLSSLEERKLSYLFETCLSFQNDKLEAKPHSRKLFEDEAFQEMKHILSLSPKHKPLTPLNITTCTMQVPQFLRNLIPPPSTKTTEIFNFVSNKDQNKKQKADNPLLKSSSKFKSPLKNPKKAKKQNQHSPAPFQKTPKSQEEEESENYSECVINKLHKKRNRVEFECSHTIPPKAGFQFEKEFPEESIEYKEKRNKDEKYKQITLDGEYRKHSDAGKESKPGSIAFVSASHQLKVNKRNGAPQNNNNYHKDRFPDSTRKKPNNYGSAYAKEPDYVRKGSTSVKVHYHHQESASKQTRKKFKPPYAKSYFFRFLSFLGTILGVEVGMGDLILPNLLSIIWRIIIKRGSKVEKRRRRQIINNMMILDTRT